MPNYRKCVYTFGEVRLTEHPMGHALTLVKKDGKAEFVHPMLPDMEATMLLSGDEDTAKAVLTRIHNYCENTVNFLKEVIV